MNLATVTAGLGKRKTSHPVDDGRPSKLQRPLNGGVVQEGAAAAEGDGDLMTDDADENWQHGQSAE